MKPATASSLKVRHGVFAFFLLVANLRPALTSVGPVPEAIRSRLGLSDAAAGLLPTLPLPIFAGVYLFARFGEAFGVEKTLAWCLALIVAGIALRSQGSIAALFAGERVTKADEETQVKATVFHAGSEPPVVKHFIASTSMPTKRDHFRNNRTP